MTAPTPGARFAQLQPIVAKGNAGLDGTGSPYILLTVPAGATYRLRRTRVALSVSTDSTFATPGGLGCSISIQDSNGNLYAGTEVFLAGPSQASANDNVFECDNATLPAGTTLQIVMTHADGAATGFHLRGAGGAIWRLA